VHGECERKWEREENNCDSEVNARGWEGWHGVGVREGCAVLGEGFGVSARIPTLAGSPSREKERGVRVGMIEWGWGVDRVEG
jgi:hypothetical protein